MCILTEMSYTALDAVPRGLPSVEKTGTRPPGETKDYKEYVVVPPFQIKNQKRPNNL
jgi:hypothetical protein